MEEGRNSAVQNAQRNQQLRRITAEQMDTRGKANVNILAIPQQINFRIYNQPAVTNVKRDGCSMTACRTFSNAQRLTTFCGVPARKARMFSAVTSMMRWRLSFGAQEICGVMMQFFAVTSGLSGRIGSV